MPAIRLWYLLIDHQKHPLGKPYRVDVPPDADVADLLEKIKETESPVLANVEIAALSVWKLGNFPESPIAETLVFNDILNEFLCTISPHLSHDSVDPTKETKAMLLFYGKVISQLGDWPRNKLHIIVQLPEYREHKRKRNEAIGSDLRPPEVKLLKTVLGQGSPSSLAHAPRFREIVGPQPDHAITCNRPFEYDTIPLVLLHDVFGIFQDRCEAPPSVQALMCLEELAEVCCQWHETEATRRSVVQFVLQKHTDIVFHEEKVPGTEFMTGGNLINAVMPASIRECKNERGDALPQAILYYGNFLEKALENPLCYHNCNTRFPSILMVDTGPLLGFYGAAWDGVRVRAEPLTPLFDLSTHWAQTQNRHAIASSLDALIVAVRNIQAHYDTVQAEAKAHLVPSKVYNRRLQTARGYPFLTSYDDNGEELTFTYDSRLDNTKFVFSATLDQPNSEQRIVKFTQRYSEAAHNYLHSRGSAPKLRKCVRVSAEWTGVIMDKSRYRKLHEQRFLEAEQEKVRQKVRCEVQMLHNEGFVHGDIRDTNLLIDLDSLTSDEVLVHFIDFDWAGLIGEARYPIGVNTVTVMRPSGVMPGGLITKQHDEDMVSYLFRSV